MARFWRSFLLLIVALVVPLGACHASVAAQRELKVLSPASVISLSTEEPGLRVRFSEPVPADRLRTRVSVTDAHGEALVTDLVRVDASTFMVVFARGKPGPYRVRIAKGVTSALGASTMKDREILVRARPSPPARRVVRPPLLGVDTNHTPGFEDQLPGWARELGADFVREGRSMRGINPDCLPATEYQRWDWSSLDQRLGAYQQAGVSILLIALQYNAPPCASADPNDPEALIKSPALYADFVDGLVRHLGDRGAHSVIGLELGNEPDVPRFWRAGAARPAARPGSAEQYYLYLSAAAARARERRDAAGLAFKILSGGYGGASTAWWRDLMSRPQMSRLVDGLSVHAYPFNGAPAELSVWSVGGRVVTAWQAARRAGLGEKPIWLTEYGVQTDSLCPWSVDEAAQGDLLVRGISEVAALKGPRIAAVAWFNLQDDIRDAPPRAGPWPTPNCFRVYGMGLVGSAGRRRPAFSRFRELTELRPQESRSHVARHLPRP